MKKKARYNKKSPRIGVQAWNLKCLEEMLDKMMGEAFRIATEERYDVFVEFVSGSRVKPVDPTEIKIDIPLGAKEYEDPQWSITITEIVDWFIEINCLPLKKPGEELYDPGNLGNFSEDSVGAAMSIRDSLRELADRIDHHINNPAWPTKNVIIKGGA